MPDEGDARRLLSAEGLDAIGAMVRCEPLTEAQSQVLDMILPDDVQYDYLLLDHIDAQAVRIAELDAALQETTEVLEAVEWRCDRPETWQTAIDHARAVLPTDAAPLERDG